MSATNGTSALRPPTRDELLGRAIQRYLHSPFSDDLISPPQDIIVAIDKLRFDFATPLDVERNPRVVPAILRPIYAQNYNRDSFVVNFVAWEAEAPYIWWRWDPERDPVLGLDYLDLCRAKGWVCIAVDTPQEWAKVQLGNACCVLNWEQTDLRIFEGLKIRSSTGFEKSYARGKRGRWKAHQPRFER